jgi:small-conductance mechanosensitive channel
MLNDALNRADQVINFLSRWMPNWLVGLLVLLVAGGIAAWLCRRVVHLLDRFIARFGIVPAMLFNRSQGPSSALLVLFVLGAALPFAPFSNTTTLAIGHVLLAASIVVIGWAALNTLDMLSNLYLHRVRLDVEDNLTARKHVTQVGILRGAARVLIILLTAGIALMTSASVRQYGVSLFASAGAAGLVVGLAARPLLSNLLAGIQIAMTQPIRLEDAVVVEGEWGWIERIASTYVVVRIWDLRRLILPLTYFIEQPFQNWTHQSADLLGTVMLNVDYSVPVSRIREKLQEVVKNNVKWDGKVAGVQVTDLPGTMVQVRLLVSARNSGMLFDLRCDVREAIITWLYAEYPHALPRQRTELSGGPVDVVRARTMPERGLNEMAARRQA